MKIAKIGIIIGGGSGPKLAEIFVRFLREIGEGYGMRFKFYINDYPTALSNFHTDDLKRLGIELFSTHLNHNKTEILKEILSLNRIVSNWVKQEVCCIFRTSIDANVLYGFRQIAQSVKLIVTEFGNKKLLIFRDELQGFYALRSRKYNSFNQSITLKSKFTYKNFKDFLSFIIRSSRQQFNNENFKLFIIYKFHLFENIIEEWIVQILREKKFYNYKIVQPDTGITEFLNIFHTTERGNYVFAVGNEVGDLIHEFVLKVEGKLYYKLFLYTTNFYLKYCDIPIYQTVHGSADDKSPEEICPIATIRIAAKILSNLTGKSKLFIDTNRIARQILIENTEKFTTDLPLEQSSWNTNYVYNKIVSNLKNINHGKSG